MRINRSEFVLCCKIPNKCTGSFVVNGYHTFINIFPILAVVITRFMMCVYVLVEKGVETQWIFKSDLVCTKLNYASVYRVCNLFTFIS